MLSIQLYALISVVIVSLVSLVGLFALSFNEKFLRKCIYLLVSLAVGALLGDALIHLYPEALERGSSTLSVSFFALLGIVGFFVLEKFLHWHHAHGTESMHVVNEKEKHKHTIKPVGFLVLISDGIHNFIDGLIIGASYFVSIEVGIATTIAVILHEIPQEIGDFGLLLHAGFSKAKALFVNFLSALAAVLGVIIVIILGDIDSFVPALLAFAAGSFIYIAGSDLIPELHKTVDWKRSLGQFFAVLVGMALMFLLLLFEA